MHKLLLIMLRLQNYVYAASHNLILHMHMFIVTTIATVTGYGMILGYQAAMNNLPTHNAISKMNLSQKHPGCKKGAAKNKKAWVKKK